MSLQASTITRIAVVATALPTFTLLCHRFWACRAHFVVSARQPLLTLLAALFMFVPNAVNLISTILGDLNLTPTVARYLLGSSGAMSYMAVALIIYRLLCVYDEWIASNTLYQQRDGILRNTMESQTQYIASSQVYTLFGRLALSKKTAHRVIKVILCCQFVYFSVAFQFDELRAVRIANWCVFLLLSGMLLLKTRKIKDNLGCIYETYLAVGLVVAMMFIMVLLNLIIPIEWTRVIASVCTLSAGHMLLGFSMLMIWRSQKASVADIRTTAGVPQQSAIALSVVSHSENVPRSLYEYLAQQENYEQFARFLAGAFALENLLYFARVIMFRNALLSALNVDQDEWRPSGTLWNDVFSLRFEYLGSVNLNENQNDVDEAIRANATEIYNQFICHHAVQQVNISWEDRENLHSFFAANRKHECSDYLVVFNDSVLEKP